MTEPARGSGPSVDELPGDPDHPRPATVHRFDEAAKREYVLLVEQGYRLGRAADALHFSMRTVRAARRADPQFDLEVREAEEDAAEPVEQKLYEAALNGEPWAVKLWMANRSTRYDRGEDGRGPAGSGVVVNVGVVSSGTADAALDSLRRRLETRRDGVIEVGVVEPPAEQLGAGAGNAEGPGA